MRSVAPPKSRLASSSPARTATGVSSCLPSHTSPTAKMCGTLVHSSATGSLPDGATCTPAAGRFSPARSGVRPVAKKIVSYCSIFWAPLPPTSLNTTCSLPLGSLVMAVGWYPTMIVVPRSSINAPILSAHCRSKPRSKMDRAATVTS